MTGTVEDLVTGLELNGYPVKRRRNNWVTTTRACHGGDSPEQLLIKEGPDGTPQMKCLTNAECGPGLAKRVHAAAGLKYHGSGGGGNWSGAYRKSTSEKAAERWESGVSCSGGLMLSSPLRRWLDNESVWPDSDALPLSLRWVPPWYGHQGAGSLAGLLGRPGEWTAGTPSPRAVHFVNITAAGGKALDAGGIPKRTMGQSSGKFCLLGDVSAERVVLVEGLKDGIAAWRLFREQGAAVAAFAGAGTASEAGVLGWLSGKREVLVAFDKDKSGSDGMGAGDKAAFEVRRCLVRLGMDVSRIRRALPTFGKDLSESVSALASGAGSTEQYEEEIDAEIEVEAGSETGAVEAEAEGCGAGSVGAEEAGPGHFDGGNQDGLREEHEPNDAAVEVEAPEPELHIGRGVSLNADCAGCGDAGRILVHGLCVFCQVKAVPRGEPPLPAWE